MFRMAVAAVLTGFLIGLWDHHERPQVRIKQQAVTTTVTVPCTHGESSTMVVVRGGKVVVVQPPTLTGCLP